MTIESTQTETTAAAEEVVALAPAEQKSDAPKAPRKAAKTSFARKLAGGKKAPKAPKAKKGAQVKKNVKAKVPAMKTKGAKASKAKRDVAKKPRISGTKAQTQVAKDVMQMIKREAKEQKVRPADVVRSVIYKHFKFSPEVRA